MLVNHKDVIKAFTEISREIGGRGPKNIHIKQIENKIEIHFLLLKSHLENFIYSNHHDGKDCLTKMNYKIFEITKEKFERLIGENISAEVKINHFEFDIDKDKYLMILDILTRSKFN